MKLDKEKYKVHPIIADGIMSVSTLGEGRPIPCIIMDKNHSYEIAELCKIHKDTPPGDAETVWVRPFSFTKPKEVILKISFKSTIELSDKVSDLKNESILIEVQRKSFNKNWQVYLEDTLKKKYKDKGIPKHQINQLVNQHIKSMREVWNLRRD